MVSAGVGAAGQAGLFGGGGGVKMPNVKLQGVGNVEGTPTIAGAEHELALYMDQYADIPGLSKMTSYMDTVSNQQYQKMLSSLDPNLLQQVSKIGDLASTYLSGQIPQDVQDQIQRATAQQSMQGGYAGTQMGRNLTLRDLGMTSIQAEQLGTQLSGTAATMSAALNPSFTPISSLLFTPQQIAARNDQAAYYNTDVANQQQIINATGSAMGSLGAGGGVSQGISALASSVGNFFGGSKGYQGSAAQGLIAGITKLMGGGGGGGTGSTTSGGLTYGEQALGLGAYGGLA